MTPATSWQAPSERGRDVPGAPGLVFAETAPRFVAFFIDTILLAIIGSVIAAVLGYGTTVVTRTPNGTSTFVSVSGAAFAIPLAILSLVYFVFFWTGGRRATIGQRIFNIQVGNAFDGRGLTIDQAVRRWLGLGMAIGLLALIPSHGHRGELDRARLGARAAVHDRHQSDQAGPARPVRRLGGRAAGRQREWCRDRRAS